MYLELLRPKKVMDWSLYYLPLLVGLVSFFLVVALYLSCWVDSLSVDFQQGETVRIIYIHVPAAWMSLVIYGLITVSSILFLLTRHPLFHLVSQTGSHCGAVFTLLTLCSGCLWGKPMWGTFWVWDARLTSVLILLFIYLGAIRFHSLSADIACIFICLGFINIPIIKFSVNWWNTLHQPSSISQFGTSIHVSMLIPILLMFVCFMCFVLSVFLMETRRSILNHVRVCSCM